MKPELIADYACVTGEGPLWHPGEKRLYWVDIPTGRLFRYTPSDGTHEQVHEGEQIGGFTIQADGALLFFMAGGAVKIWREGARCRWLGACTCTIAARTWGTCGRELPPLSSRRA